MRLSRDVLAAAVVTAFVLWPAPMAAAQTADCAAVTRPAMTAEGAPAVLACVDLRGLEFQQKQLDGADLHGSNLSGVSFLQAGLDGADLHGADLTDADLRQADLAGANLRGADLTGAHLGQADLTNADLRGAVLADTYAVQAHFDDADLRGADLTGANLGQAWLTGTDLRDADLTGATMSQTETDGAVGLPDAPGIDAPAEVGRTTEAQPAEAATQIAHVLLWPSAAIALAWWRLRVGYLRRHRAATPGRVLTGIAGIGLVVTGGYLAVVGAARGFGHLVGGARWSADPGPLVWFSAPHHQLAAAAGALVLGGIAVWLPRRRPAGPAQSGAQVAIGTPSPGRTGPDFGAAVRVPAVVAGYAGLADLALTLILTVTGNLPDAGPWQAGTVLGHLGFVAVFTLTMAQLAVRTHRSDDTVTTLTGVVFAGGGRDPYLWLSGTAAKRSQPASQVLPWDALRQVHLIRVLGTTDPAAMMITVRKPGTDRPVEYPTELAVTPDQVAALRALLPEEMFTEHTRAAAAS